MEDAKHIRVQVTLPADMFNGLERLSLKAKMSSGKRLTYNALINASIAYMLESDINTSRCENEDDILRALRATRIKRR